MAVEPYVPPECPDQMDETHLREFQKLGFIAFESLLSRSEVEAACQALTEITVELLVEARDGRADVVDARVDMSYNYAGPNVRKRDSDFSIQFEPDVDPRTLSPEEAEQKFRKLSGFYTEHEAIAALANGHPRISGFMDLLLGEQVVLRSDMALSKPAYIGSEKPWHQDNAYFEYLPLEALATAWIALDDATVENGCMFALPGDHTRGALRHHRTTDCEIMADRIQPERAMPVPLKAGGAMFFSAMLPHQTPPNRSPHRRRALQFQYRTASARKVSREDHGKVFAEADGLPASCAFAHETG